MFHNLKRYVLTFRIAVAFAQPTVVDQGFVQKGSSSYSGHQNGKARKDELNIGPVPPTGTLLNTRVTQCKKATRSVRICQ